MVGKKIDLDFSKIDFTIEDDEDTVEENEIKNQHK